MIGHTALLEEAMMTHPHWHLALHGRPEHAAPGPQQTIDGRPLTTLDLQGRLASQPLPTTFDDVYRRLEALPLFVEPDGSFCWTAPQAVWRIFGELYDAGPQLMYIELKGYCPRPEWEQLLAAVSASPGGGSEATSNPSELLVQLIPQGVFCTAEDFTHWAYA